MAGDKTLQSIRDNFSNGSVGDFLSENINRDARLSFVTAYFTIYAYEKLRVQLDNISSMRLLFGEPRFIKSVSAGADTRSYKIEEEKLIIPPEGRLQQKMIARQCSEWIKEKVEIRSMVRPDFLHGKMYHIEKANGVNEAIQGSSNFTVNGLGLGNRPNMELNLVVNDKRDLADLKEWFDRLWNNQIENVEVEDVKEKVLQYLGHLYEENSPEFIYYKTLFHLFDKYLDERNDQPLFNEKTGFLDTQIWNTLYRFQQDAVKGAINKIMQFGGCIIADSVGLGKTYEALAIIKYFELLNKNVLVLCPKKLSNNWTVYQRRKNSTLNPFEKDKFDYTVLFHTDMGREGVSAADGLDLSNFSWGNYDLVVIDESHNFRGNPSEKELEDGSTKMNRVKWLLEKIIKEGVDTKVLLLSATPVNNTLRDLRNQVNLITKENQAALLEAAQIPDIAATLKLAQTHFTNWANPVLNSERKVSDLMNRLGTDFVKLLDTLTIARSRKHVIQFYGKDNVGHFPERLPAVPKYPKLDTENRFLSYDKLNKIIIQYKLSIFNPTKYVKIEQRSKYEARAGGEIKAFKQADRENFLINMMKINFLKRLESSVESFQISMDRTIRKIETLIERINDFKTKHPDKGQISIFDAEPDEDEKEDLPEDEEQWLIGKKLQFEMKDLNLDNWLADLEKDKEALSELYNVASAITPDRDAKLQLLKETILQKVKKGLNEGNKKVIVFTAFADTAKYLFDHLKDWAQTTLKVHTALVAGSAAYTTYGKAEFNHILTHFSPVSKRRNKMNGMKQDAEIDLLIATDCISEGQNLQDCDFLINYDIHWNPVRIIQRFGRIDRLGSKNKEIQLVNFWPTEDLDGYLNLKERVEARMALVDVTATGEDNLLNPEQLEDLITEDLKYRNHQLKRLQTEVLDLDELQQDGVSLTDFTLDDYRIDLWNFIQENRERLEQSPNGLYAVVPAPAGAYSDRERVTLFNQQWIDIIQPGIIYCLKQEEQVDGGNNINPLFPYFLVYIRNDGTVRYAYAQSKPVLEMMRVLCQNRKAPYEELCKLFNAETNNGANMEAPDKLLKAAIEETERLFRKKNLGQLTSGSRHAVLATTKNNADSGYKFELVTWLVIK
ncbi:MAG TPA: helicase-related protein [Chitinophagaceae bacterium]|jgi:superfamily II DNA or RNA helicase|nr:helicase-related protein [Chitinophagaceae bacterium]